MNAFVTDSTKDYINRICTLRGQENISQRYSMFALGGLCLTHMSCNTFGLVVFNQHWHQA